MEGVTCSFYAEQGFRYTSFCADSENEREEVSRYEMGAKVKCPIGRDLTGMA